MPSRRTDRTEPVFPETRNPPPMMPCGVCGGTVAGDGQISKWIATCRLCRMRRLARIRGELVDDESLEAV